LLICISPALAQEGTASFYGGGEKLNDEVAYRNLQFDERLLEAASYEWKLGTVVRVINTENEKGVVVRITDRGPNKRLGRLIDLTKHAFEQIADTEKGIIKVKVEEAGTYNERREMGDEGRENQKPEDKQQKSEEKGEEANDPGKMP